MAVTTSSKIMSAGSMEFGQVAPTVPSGIFFHSPIANHVFMSAQYSATYREISRLHELAQTTRGSQGAGSQNLLFTF